MAGYSTPAWTNNAAPSIDATALTNMGQGIELAQHPYGVCSTASSTAAKTVTIDYSGTLTLFAGLTVRVKFSNANTASNPTLNVNSTGAVSIMTYNTTAAGSGAWAAGEIVTFTYDGTNWIQQNEAGIREILVVDLGTVTGTGSSVTASKSDSRIGTDHTLLNWSFGTPSAVTGNMTWTTAGGTFQIAGPIDGSTNITVVLGKISATIT